MDALITAGGIPKPEDPLYEYANGKTKALMDVAGKPMIQWVLDALSGAGTIDQVVVIGLTQDSGVSCEKKLFCVPDQGGMLDNIRTGVGKVIEVNPGAEFTLIVSSDVPTITSEMVDWSVNTALETEHDLYYNIILREVMERRFPGSNRSYVRLKNGDVCGGDMNVVRSSVVVAKDAIWSRLISARKNALRQAAMIGFDTLFLLLLRRLTLESAVPRVCKRLDLRGRAIRCPYAEIGMDVDKPYQLEIVRAALAQGAAA
jgi:GTP:adenosylcobinamide-phosphate guanylyltransferase